MFLDYDEKLAELAASKDVRIIADHGDLRYFKYIRINVLKTMPAFLKRYPIVNGIASGLFLYYESLKFKNPIFLTYAGKRGLVLAAIQYLLSPFVKPKPHVMFDCLFEPGRTVWAELCLRSKVAIINSVVDTCVVYGVPDVQNFSSVLGIKREKMRFVRYHNTVQGFSFETKDGGYVFSGGTEGREFEPLIDACLELRIPLRIATQNKKLIRRWAGHPFIQVRSVTIPEFVTWMAESRLVVVPHGKSILRTGGHQTFINAMWMGKAVILYNSDIAKGYVTHGKDAIVVEYGDHNALRESVRLLFLSAEIRESLGKEAKRTTRAMGLTGVQWAKRVYSIAAGRFLGVDTKS